MVSLTVLEIILEGKKCITNVNKSIKTISDKIKK